MLQKLSSAILAQLLIVMFAIQPIHLFAPPVLQEHPLLLVLLLALVTLDIMPQELHALFVLLLVKLVQARSELVHHASMLILDALIETVIVLMYISIIMKSPVLGVHQHVKHAKMPQVVSFVLKTVLENCKEVSAHALQDTMNYTVKIK